MVSKRSSKQRYTEEIFYQFECSTPAETKMNVMERNQQTIQGKHKVPIWVFCDHLAIVDQGRKRDSQRHKHG
jgi:hypothetical protein